MVFIPKTLWDGLPLSLASHMHRTWHVGIPFEPDIKVLVPGEHGVRIHRMEGSGNWFCGSVLPETVEKSPPAA